MSELRITIRHKGTIPTAVDWVITEDLFLFLKEKPELLGKELVNKIERIGFPPPKLSGGHERHDGGWDATWVPCC